MTEIAPLTESELKREEAHAFQDGSLSRKQFWTHEEVRRLLVTIRSLQAEKAAQADAIKAARALVTAPALSGVRAQVAGWNGEGREGGPFPRHPSRLGARIETNCGRIYDLDERMTAAAAALAKIDTLTGGRGE